MAKRTIRIITIFLLLSIFLANNTLADYFYPISTPDSVCSIHGDIILGMRTSQGVNVKDIIVKIKHSSEPSFYEIEGNWYNNKDNKLTTLYANTQVKFRSSGTFFTKTGEYSIRVYKGDTYQEISLNCPKFEFSCNDIKIDIKKCYTKDNNFIIVFLGNGLESQQKILDLEKDVEYRIESQRQVWNFNSLPQNLSFSRLENETYMMTFPRNRNYSTDTNKLEEVEIRIKENLVTIPYIGSGCDRGDYNKLYLGTQDLETKCPTQIEMKDNEIEIISTNISNEIEEEEERGTEITGKVINDESEIKESFKASILIAGTIGFVFGTVITFLIMIKKK